MKRLLSWLLALVMIISCLPMSAIPAFAAVDVEDGTGTPDFEVDFDEFTENKLVDGDNAVELTEGDRDGESYIYTATSAGELNINVTALSAYEVVEFDENGEPVYGWSECPPRQIAMAFGRNYAILANGESVGASGKIEVAEGEEVEIQVLSYVGAAAKMTVNLAVTEPVIPGTTADTAIYLDWEVVDGAYTAIATVPANSTYYFKAYYAVEYDFSIVENVEYAVDAENYILSITNDTDAEASYTLRAAIPAGQYDNPEVINGWTNIEITKEFVDTYYYVWVATQEDTVTLDVTDGYNLQVVQKYFDGTEDVQIDHNLVEMDEVVVKENLVIEVQEGDVLLITVASRGLEETPASYTLTGSLKSAEPAGPIADDKLVFYRYALSFQEYTGLQFIVRNSVIENYDRVYAHVSQNAPEGVVESDMDYTTKGSYSYFNKDILSWSMTEEVSITLYAEKDGKLYVGESVTTSVMEQAILKVPNATAAQKTVLIDMLNYGAAVQTSFDHNAENLPNETLEELGYAQYATKDEPALNATNSVEGTGTVDKYRESLSLQSKVELQVIFRLTAFENKDVTKYKAEITMGGTTTTVLGQDFRPSGTSYSIVPVVFAPYMLRETCTVVIKDLDGNVVSPVYTYSVEGLAKAKLNGTSADDVIYAMMKFGDAVAALM